MCGLAGFIGCGANASSLQIVAEAMNETLAHRGPDDSGLWVDERARVALTHKRLSIIDLSSAGHQPMVSADDRYVMVYNGEVYNHSALRRELEDLGHAFKGGSDTEVIFTALIEWGIEAAVARFIGMFAIALWDRRDENLVLIRDRLGIKPLYWSNQQGAFIFASELKAFHGHPSFAATIDPEAFSAYLRFACVPADQSIFRDVHKLPAGCVLRYKVGSDPVIQCYWDIQEVAQNTENLTDEAEALERFQDLLRDATRLRMISDAPIGAFLSGGLDSSTVVAVMQSLSDKPIKTFTVGFKEQGYDESSDAAHLAKQLGTEHHPLMVSADDAIAVIPALPSIYDEPFADSSQIPTYLVSKFARETVTVCLSGDGGDELLAGYNRHVWAHTRFGKINGIPSPLRRMGASAIRLLRPSQWDVLGHMVSERRRIPQFGDKLYKLADTLSANSIHEQYSQLVSQWSNPWPGLVGGCDQPADHWSINPAWAASGLSPMARMQLADSRGYLADDILTKVDRASMAVGLEARVPLLDHRLAELSWSLPDGMKCRDGLGKWVLRNTLDAYMPRRPVARQKSGFAIPIGAWLKGPIRDWAESLLSEQRLKQDGFFDSKVVKAIWDEHLKGQRNHDARIWTILMFQAWFDRWMRVPT